jgi:MGT family glycosyltransferase
VATAEPFDYPHPDWDDSIQLIGACSYDPAPSTVPEWLAQIDRPIVLASTSSEDQGDFDLARVALAALAEEPVHVVATFPAGVPPDIAAPANATVCQFLPHSLVLDRAACAITHGGMGVTQKALARGVPVCVVPYGRDQLEVARRVEVAKCGTRLLTKDLTASRMRDNVLKAMSMTDGARRVADGYAATGGAARGADLIEQRLLTASQLPSRKHT